MNIQAAIQSVLDKKDLSSDEMNQVMKIIMTGEATPAQIGGFLIGLRMKGETSEEIAGAASTMRRHAVFIDPAGLPVVDTCGRLLTIRM